MSTSHRSLPELFLTFFNGEVIPYLVEETIRLHKKGESSKDIVSELSKGIIETSDSSIGKSAKKSPPVSSAAKTHSWVSIDEYLQKYEQKDHSVCHYVNSKGDSKDKICCRELPADHDLSGERDKFRCTVHKRGQSQRTVSALLRDFKQEKTKGTSTSDTQRIAKIKSSLNESKAESSLDSITGKVGDQGRQKSSETADVSDTNPAEGLTATKSVEKKTRSNSSKPAGRPPLSTFSGKGESIAEKVRRKNEEHKKQTRTPTTSGITVDDAASESRENSVEKQDLRLVKDNDSSDEDRTRISKPAESSSDDYPVPVTVDNPSANKYTWMQFSDTEFLILCDDVTITCYGVYNTDVPHDHEKVLQLPSSWRELVKSPQGSSLQYLRDNDIKVEKL